MHIDEEFAKNAGYPGVFAHGMLSMGYLGEFLVKAAGVGNVRKFRARFAKLTWPGDVITCKGTVTAVRDEGGTRARRLRHLDGNADRRAEGRRQRHAGASRVTDGATPRGSATGTRSRASACRASARCRA